MDPVLSLVIHEILPTKILDMIFEEHARLEWKAPTVDGRVCRLWRQTSLNTPRVWAHFEIRNDSMPNICGSIDSVQRLSTLMSATQNGTLMKSCMTYSVTITQESHLCKCGSLARLSLKGETFHACDFYLSRIGTQL